MDTEVSRWLSSISCGLDLKPLAKEFEDRGFTTKQSLKYVESSDLDIFFPSPLKLSYAHKKILLKEIEQLSNQDNAQAPISTLPTAGTSYAHVSSTSQGNSSKLSEPSEVSLQRKMKAFPMKSNSFKRESQAPNRSTHDCSNKPVSMTKLPPNAEKPVQIVICLGMIGDSVKTRLVLGSVSVISKVNIRKLKLKLQSYKAS
ncbi:hypothetical protein OS493_022055 [Desmophyllum pertusum]|uniref:SAM domain-containing protein n=1 Tax=Desmophyllum pertusum TaxID=174260 RepID=A0A9X0CSK9_9CNID|nr:hypothetical protein OS493_022055 [Desmophyllum pertusum]